MTKVLEFIAQKDVSLACITETWLWESMADSFADTPGYIILRMDIDRLWLQWFSNYLFYVWLWSELIRPGLAIWVNLAQLLYLRPGNC